MSTKIHAQAWSTGVGLGIQGLCSCCISPEHEPIDRVVVCSVLHFFAWVVACAGLGASQSSCYDLNNFPATDALFSPKIGDNCSKLFRLPWWTWCLNFVPAMSSLIVLISSDGNPLGLPADHGSTPSTLWCLVAVLNILISNAFNNVLEYPAINGEVRDRVKVCDAPACTRTRYIYSVGLCLTAQVRNTPIALTVWHSTAM